MNLRDLHYLVAVDDLRNFSQAAEQCHISQPTLSNQIKKLEDTLGVAVFERTNKRVMPTEAGEAIIQCARRITQEVEHMKALADAASDPLAGPFRLGAFPTLAPYIFPDIVPAIKATLPRLRLILMEEKTAVLLERLRKGELDAVLLALPIDNDALVSEPLFEDRFMLAVPSEHPLAGQGAVTQAALANHKLLLLEEGHCLRDQALEVCHLSGVEEEGFRATGLETLRQMVKAGTGITFMPEIAVRHGEEGICYLPFVEPAPTRLIGLVWRKTTARKQVMEYIAALCSKKAK